MAWRSNARAPRSLTRSWRLSLALSILLALCGACSALAAPNDEANRKRLDSTVRFLQNAQNSDGGFGANGNLGEPSDPLFTAWVAIALATAGINPQDQAKPGGQSAFTYLAENAGALVSTTDFERVLLVIDAAGTSPHGFGGVDVLQEILDRQLPDGGFPHEQGNENPAVNDTVFAILALSPIQADQEPVKRAAEWLENEQSSDGSWPSTCPKTVSGCRQDGNDPQGNIDMTAAAIEALNAAGMRDTEAQRRAIGYLHEAQGPDGGFPESIGESESNSASTAWTAQAIWSAGENPEAWTQRSSGREPLGYLESMQHEDGSIQERASSDENPMLVSAYAAPAFAAQPLPPPAVPRDAPSTSPAGGKLTTAAAPGSVESGQGGESTQRGDGVIAGGGGDGAPLFSRPQPQSEGHAPGGVRQLGGERSKVAQRSTVSHPRGPGPSRGSPIPTITTSAVPAEHAGTNRPGSGSASAETGVGQASSTARGEGEGGELVKGILIAAPGTARDHAGLEPGAPGLQSAGAGGSQTPWLAAGIAALIALLVLAGSQIERRRPRVIL